MKVLRSTLVDAIAGAALLGLLPPMRPAWAHAFSAAEEPAVGSTISAPPAKIVVTFNAPIETLFAKLQVLDSSGNEQTTGSPTVGADRRQLSVPVRLLSPGDYTVRWSVVAEDGHRTEGYYIFTLAPGGR